MPGTGRTSLLNAPLGVGSVIAPVPSERRTPNPVQSSEGGGTLGGAIYFSQLKNGFRKKKPAPEGGLLGNSEAGGHEKSRGENNLSKPGSLCHAFAAENDCGGPTSRTSKILLPPVPGKLRM